MRRPHPALAGPAIARAVVAGAVFDEHGLVVNGGGKVVTFTATEAKVDKITQSVAKAVGTQWIIVREKDW